VLVLREVVFLPGATGAAEFWRPVADRMPSDWKTRLLSWPGAGVEPHDPQIGGYDDLILRAADQIADGSDVVAQSMGGLVAIGLALAKPHKIRRLVLVATSGGLNVANLGGANWRAEYQREFPEAAQWVTGDAADRTPDLARIANPTCLIWGGNDPLSPVAVGATLARVLPHSSLHILREGSHMLAREHPAEVAELIIEHLR